MDDLGTVLPEGWEVKPLGELFELKQGKSLSPKSRKGGNRKPFLRTSNVLWGKIDLAVVDEMSFTKDEEKQLSLARGDLLVCEGGDIGRTALWNGELEKCYYQNHLHRLRAKSDDVEPRFYVYWMQAAFQLLDAYHGHWNKTTIPNLSQARLKSFDLPVPPLVQQRAIAAILSKIQDAIQVQEKIIDTTKRLKKSLMAKLFTEGTRGEELKKTEIGKTPQSWAVKMLTDVVLAIDYGFSAPIPKVPPEGGVRIVSTADINKDGELLYDQVRYIGIPSKTAVRLSLKDGDVLFNWRNSPELIGKTTIFEAKGEKFVFASFILRIVCDENKSHNQFLMYLLNYYREQGVFIRLSRRAVNQANYNRNEISHLLIPVPPIHEQEEIAGSIRIVELKLSTAKRQLDTLQRLFKSSLNQLMTGNIRVDKIQVT